MDLSRALCPELILHSPDVKDKWQLLNLMTETIKRGPFAAQCPAHVRDSIRDAVISREKERATGMGSGFALPHGRIPGLSGFLACLAVLPKGIEYGSPDNEPVRVACMVITPLEDPTIALKVMATLAGFMSDEAVRSFLMNVTDAHQVYAYLSKRKPSVDAFVLARDIMRSPRAVIHPDTPLREVTREMLIHHAEAVPVVDAHDCVVGEITCDLLYQRGIPDFFRQLGSVSFIRNFDPFEKYFASEGDLKACDVMDTKPCLMSEDATLLEIVFALSVKRYPKIYIVREDKLTGVVDRIAVLDRIINL